MTTTLEELPTTEQAPRTTAPSVSRRVLGLAWPLIVQNLLESLVGVVDTILVAHLGAVAIAGVGTAIEVLFFMISILMAVTIGASIMVAHAVGAQDNAAAARIAKQALSWGLVGVLPLAALGALGARSIIGVFGVAPDVAAAGTTYLQIVMVTLPGMMTIFAISAVLRGCGDTRTPMVIGLLDNCINAFLAWVLIYGQFGLPALGVAGSAWAAGISRCFGATVLLVLLLRGRGKLRLRGWHDWWPRLAPARQILALGIPAALEQVLISLSFTVMILLVATLGTITLATQQITFNALSVGFLPGFGFGMAASVLVGQSLGAREAAAARAAAVSASRWSLLWAGICAIIFLTLAHPILRIFTNDPAVIDLGVRSLHVLAFSLPLWGQGAVWSGGMRGAGNTRLPLLANVSGMWLGVSLSFLLIRFWHPTLPFLWAACFPGWALNAVVNWYFFRRINLEKVQLHAAPAAH